MSPPQAIGRGGQRAGSQPTGCTADDRNNLSIRSGSTGFFVAMERKTYPCLPSVRLGMAPAAVVGRLAPHPFRPRLNRTASPDRRRRLLPPPKDSSIDPMKARGVAAAATADWRPIGRWGPTGSEGVRWWRLRDPRDGKDRAIWGPRRRIGMGTGWQVV
jgi:hypothetical protein